MRYLKNSVFVVLILVVGCATPSQVKELSVKQNEYFDAAIEAVVLQSEALILASEKLVEQAKQRITAEVEITNKNLEAAMQGNTISADDAKETVSRISKTAMVAEAARQKLDQDLALITQKTEELHVFLKKMKEINIALDAYMQSEKMGESVVNLVLNQPTMASLLNSANDLAPKIMTNVTEIKSLLNGIN